MIKKLKVLFCCVLIGLTGCASKAPKKEVIQPEQPQVSTETLWQSHLAHMQRLRFWQMDGRIAASKGQEGGNASFVWKQMGDSYQIQFFGPFGAGSVYISGNPNNVTLTEADGKTHHAHTAETLMLQVAGWQVPLDGIRYWVLGIPTPKSQVQTQLLNTDGKLTKLQQIGWTIDYNSYHHSKQPIIPAKLDMRNGPLKVKIIVKNIKVQA